VEFEGDEVFEALGVDDVGEFVGGEVVDGGGSVGFGVAPPIAMAIAVGADEDAVFDAGEDDVALDGGMSGDDEEAVVFAGVGAGDGAGGVAAEAVGAEPFRGDGGIEVAAGFGVECDGHAGLLRNGDDERLDAPGAEVFHYRRGRGGWKGK